MKDLQVLLVSHYLNAGGAGRATWRIFEALKSVEHETRVFASLRTVRGAPAMDRVASGVPANGNLGRLLFWFRVHSSRFVSRVIFRPVEPSLCSSASVASGLGEEIEAGPWDVINLHWVGDATMSIEEIGRIEKPTIWSLHDSWPFSGAEHVTTSNRSATGYPADNRPAGERGPDLNRWVWQRKVNSWKRPFGVIAPSTWSSKVAGESQIFRDSALEVIPHPMDLNFWGEESSSSTPKASFAAEARPLRLGVGAASGSQTWVKGLHLLPEILSLFMDSKKLGREDIELWTFGDRIPGIDESRISQVPFGQLDDVQIREFYRNVDVMLVPSLFETFGLVAAEAQAAGTPVIGFEDTGVASIVEHQQTGYLASFADVADFAQGLLWVTSSSQRLHELSVASKERMATICEPQKIGRMYARFIRDFHDRFSDQ